MSQPVKSREEVVAEILKIVKTNTQACRGFVFTLSYVTEDERAELHHDRVSFNFPKNDIPDLLAWMEKDTFAMMRGR